MGCGVPVPVQLAKLAVSEAKTTEAASASKSRVRGRSIRRLWSRRRKEKGFVRLESWRARVAAAVGVGSRGYERLEQALVRGGISFESSQ